MCKWDEAFTEREMFEETGRCKDCELDCEYAGIWLTEKNGIKVYVLGKLTEKKLAKAYEKEKEIEESIRRQIEESIVDEIIWR